MLSSLCLLFGTYAFTIILLYQPGSCSEEITDTRPVIKHFLYMCIFSWLAAVLLNWKVIWHLLKLCAVQPREARQIQQYVRGQKMWQWLGIVAFGLACLNTVYVRSILSYNVYLSVTQVTNDYNVLMYFGLAALGTNINVCLQGMLYHCHAQPPNSSVFTVDMRSELAYSNCICSYDVMHTYTYRTA